MRPTYTAEAEAYREKVQAFLAEKLPAKWKGIGALDGKELETFIAEWRVTLAQSGYLAPGWQVEYGGGGLSALEQVIVAEEFTRAGVPTGAMNDVFGIQMLGNTLLLFGTEEQKRQYLPRIISGQDIWCQGYSEPNAGSDLASLKTSAVLDGDEWVLNGMKRWNSGLHHATHDIIFARTSGKPGDPVGITAFLVPTNSPGFKVEFFWWTFNMPTDHAEVSMKDVRVGSDAVFGRVDHGLELAQHFVHENRIRQAASYLGAAQYCINEAVRYSNSRVTWGKKLSSNQAIQFPLIELHTEAAMLRQLIRYTATLMDNSVKDDRPDVEGFMEFTHLVAMCDYRANRLACDAADRAMQTCGGVGYSRHMPFEHIYRHHRRYRITEGSEEIQMRKVAAFLFGYMGPRRKEFADLTWDDVDYRNQR